MVTDTSVVLKSLVAAHYETARNTQKSGQLVAWCSSVCPAEFLRAMDIFTFYPESHAVRAGAKKMAVELEEEAENRGYARDLCSYARINFGSIFSGKSPEGKVPRPDLLLCTNNLCDTLTKWYENLAEIYRVPLVLIDTPYNYREINQENLDYIKTQFKDLIKTIEMVAGKKYHYDKFQEVAVISSETSRLWREILELAAKKPAPFSSFEAFNYMTPSVIARGTQEALEYYRMLKAEVEAKVALGAAAVPGEKYRLLMDGIPLWFFLRKLSDTLKAMRVCIVSSRYTNSWILDFDTACSLEALLDNMALTYTHIWINQHTAYRADFIARLAEKFTVDGILYHCNRSCKPASLGQQQLQREVAARTGLPSLLFDGDHCDPRNFSETQFFNKLQVFMELVISRKQTG